MISEAQVILTGDTPEIQIPAGYGASGQPNDGFHQFHHALAKSWASSKIGWRASIESRRDLDQLSYGVQANVSMKLCE